MAGMRGIPHSLGQIGMPALLAVGVAAILLISTVFTGGESEPTHQDPVATAEAAYTSLMAQMGALPTATGGASATPAAEIGGPSVAVGESNLDRDLFKPVPKRRTASANASAKRRAKPRLPALTAIFIDGAVRQALLDGKLVGIGDSVRGYRIREIETHRVLLEKGDTIHTIRMGASK